MSERIVIIQGDITKVNVDAIVNAANNSLMGGGGVDGAIHRAAGPGLVQECRRLQGCRTGEAKLTSGYRLPAPYIIHTVGPIWREGKSNEDEVLARCYRNTFVLAVQNGIKTLAFPAISTGVYRFPLERATRIALTETLKFLETHDSIKGVIFVCFDKPAKLAYDTLFAELTAVQETPAPPEE